MTDDIIIRMARPADVEGIVALINEYAAEKIMLARTPASVELALQDFVVASDARGRMLACGALKEYSPSLAEVASVAVSREAQGRGLGRHIVQAVEQLAERRGVEELFALTTTPAFFEAVGYGVSDRARYPEKIRRDCVSCLRRFACPEVCVTRFVAASHAERFAAAA